MTNRNGMQNLAHLESEKALLGAILLDETVLVELSTQLHPDDFFFDSNRIIYNRMLEMRMEKTPINIVTLSQNCMMHGELSKIGNASYVSSLTDGIPRTSDASHYAKTLENYRAKRTLAHIGENLRARAAETTAPHELAEEFGSSLRQISSRRRQGLESVGELFDRKYDSIDQAFSSGMARAGTKTGFPAFDSMTMGLHRGEMAVVAARPSVGKTAFAMNVAVNVAKSGKAVAVFSLEMTSEALLWRAIASEAMVDSSRIRGGFTTKAERDAVMNAYIRLRGSSLFINDTSIHLASQIHAHAALLRDRVGLDLVVVDYLQLMNGQKRENRTQEISFISRGLKEAAKDLEVPFLVLSQLNRAAEDRERPRLSDLRESGQIEQDADLVLFLYQEKAAQATAHASRGDSSPAIHPITNELQFAIAKQRNGPTGEFTLMFNRSHCRFYSKGAGDVGEF